MAKRVLDLRELSMVIASLRLYQRLLPDGLPAGIPELASDEGAREPLSDEEIDGLIELLNFSGDIVVEPSHG